MSIKYYFSSDPNKRAKYIFNLIAPIYKRADRILIKNFSFMAERIRKERLVEGKTILDLGSGTGAWGNSLKNIGAKSVHGVDIAEKMVKIAAQKYPENTYTVGNIEDLKEIESDSFDVVTASYVLHGVSAPHRRRILNEMKRIGRSSVIIQDYVGNTPTTAKFLEFLEKSDYKNFKKNFAKEFENICHDIKMIPMRLGSGLYLGKLNKNVSSENI